MPSHDREDGGSFFLTALTPQRSSTLRTSMSTPALTSVNSNVHIAPLGRPQICSAYPTAPRVLFPTMRRCTDNTPVPVNRTTLIGSVHTLPGPYSNIESPGPGRYSSVPALGKQRLSQLRGCAKYSFAPPPAMALPRRRAGPLFLPKLTERQYEERMTQWDASMLESVEQLEHHRVEMDRRMHDAATRLDSLVQRLTQDSHPGAASDVVLSAVPSQLDISGASPATGTAYTECEGSLDLTIAEQASKDGRRASDPNASVDAR